MAFVKPEESFDHLIRRRGLQIDPELIGPIQKLGMAAMKPEILDHAHELFERILRRRRVPAHARDRHTEFLQIGRRDAGVCRLPAKRGERCRGVADIGFEALATEEDAQKRKSLHLDCTEEFAGFRAIGLHRLRGAGRGIGCRFQIFARFLLALLKTRSVQAKADGERVDRCRHSIPLPPGRDPFVVPIHREYLHEGVEVR